MKHLNPHKWQSFTILAVGVLTFLSYSIVDKGKEFSLSNFFNLIFGIFFNVLLLFITFKFLNTKKLDKRLNLNFKTPFFLLISLVLLILISYLLFINILSPVYISNALISHLKPFEIVTLKRNVQFSKINDERKKEAVQKLADAYDLANKCEKERSEYINEYKAQHYGFEPLGIKTPESNQCKNRLNTYLMELNYRSTDFNDYFYAKEECKIYKIYGFDFDKIYDPKASPPSKEWQKHVDSSFCE